MPRQILLLAIVITAAISSCTTAYKTGQTPDDVYYSPARPQEEYVRVDDRDDRNYRYDDEYYDDRYLRMKVRNRNRWNDLNDWYYYDRYSYSYNYYYGSWNNPYNSWHYYNNPYYCCCNTHVYVPKGPINYNIAKPRNFSLSGYTNTNNNNSNAGINVKAPRTGTSRPVFNNSNSNAQKKSNSSGVGSTIRRLFTSGSNNNSNSDNSNSSGSTNRTYNPSSSSSSSSGSSGSSSGNSGGGVSRPNRGGN